MLDNWVKACFQTKIFCFKRNVNLVQPKSCYQTERETSLSINKLLKKAIKTTYKKSTASQFYPLRKLLTPKSPKKWIKQSDLQKIDQGLVQTVTRPLK